MRNRRTRSALTSLLLCALVVAAACSSTSTGNVVDYFVDEDGRTLGIGLATCNASAKVLEVDESDETVGIKIETYGRSDDDCRDGITVELSEPLGDRQVIDLHDQSRVRNSRADELAQADRVVGRARRDLARQALHAAGSAGPSGRAQDGFGAEVARPA